MGYFTGVTVGLSILLLVAQKPTAQDDGSSVVFNEVGVQAHPTQCPQPCDNKDLKAQMADLSKDVKAALGSSGGGGGGGCTPRVVDESQDTVRMTVVNSEDATVIRYPQEDAFCSGKSRIHSRFYKSKVARVSKVSECITHCSRTGHSGVIQLTGANDSGRDCTCSSVPVQYMKLVPKRYLHCVTGGDPTVDIYYRSDLIPANVASMVKPLLFYALDDVSGITNIGSLTGDAYNARFDQGTGHFDCPISGV